MRRFFAAVGPDGVGVEEADALESEEWSVLGDDVIPVPEPTAAPGVIAGSAGIRGGIAYHAGQRGRGSIGLIRDLCCPVFSIDGPRFAVDQAFGHVSVMPSRWCRIGTRWVDSLQWCWLECNQRSGTQNPPFQGIERTTILTSVSDQAVWRLSDRVPTTTTDIEMREGPELALRAFSVSASRRSMFMTFSDDQIR